jgi:hypothetical protein
MVAKLIMKLGRFRVLHSCRICSAVEWRKVIDGMPLELKAARRILT